MGVYSFGLHMDIRVNVSFINHRKRKKLRMLIGPCATDCLLDLWLSTAMNHPSGVLDGMKPIDIALECNFEGDPNALVSALIDCGLIEIVDGVYQLHDWQEHQAYVITAPTRISKARKAAAARWGVQDDAPSMPQVCSKHATSMLQAMLNDESSNAKSEIEQCPLHYSTLHDSTLQNTFVPCGTDKPSLDKKADSDFEAFWKEYPRKDGKKKAQEAWNKNKKHFPSMEYLISKLNRQKESLKWQKNNGQFIPMPTTWINGHRWLDEVEIDTVPYQQVADIYNRELPNLMSVEELTAIRKEKIGIVWAVAQKRVIERQGKEPSVENCLAWFSGVFERVRKSERYEGKFKLDFDRLMDVDILTSFLGVEGR